MHRALRKAYLGVGNNEESPVLLKRGLSSKGIATECLAEETMLEHFGKYGGTMNRALTKADIVEAIYEKTDRNRADVKNTVEILLGLMKQAIKKDDALLVSGFGKFEAYDKEARKGRNPQTDETITLPPRKVVVFRLSRKFGIERRGS